MFAKQSNNILPGIRSIINGMEGKNYALDDYGVYNGKIGKARIELLDF